jgi:hypothetical protein
MISNRPPRLATWLLRCSGLAEENIPLAGDLMEEFQNGRSAAWFWRQTLVAIATSAGRNARRFHRYLLAIVAGWTAQAGIAIVLWRFHVPSTLHGLAWGIVALLGVILIVLPRHSRSPSREATQGLRTLAGDKGVSHQSRAALLAVLAASRLGYLVGYFLLALLVPNLTLAVLASVELSWLVWDTASALRPSDPKISDEV